MSYSLKTVKGVAQKLSPFPVLRPKGRRVSIKKVMAKKHRK